MSASANMLPSGASEGRAASTAKVVLKRLRSTILELPERHYLGSGGDLCLHYGISRPTLHQVARALEHEQLVEVRRGPNGGYYVRRPSLKAAVAAVSTYLRASDVQLGQFLSLGRIVHAEVCRAATLSTDDSLWEQLAHQDRTFWSSTDEADVATLLRRDYALEGILFALSANPVVTLFMQSMHQFWYDTITVRLLAPERVGLWIRLRHQLCTALMAGDARIAAAISETHWDYVTAWLREASLIGPASVPPAGA